MILYAKSYAFTNAKFIFSCFFINKKEKIICTIKKNVLTLQKFYMLKQTK